MRQIFLLEDDAALGRGIAMALRGPEADVICRATLAQARETLAGWTCCANLEPGGCRRR